MPLTQEQQSAKNEAADGVAKGMETEVAKILKENYDGLKYALGNNALADAGTISSDKFREMAKQAIDRRQIDFPTTGGGTVTISLNTIEEKLKSQGSGELEKILAARGAGSMDDLVPTRDQVNKIANEVGEAAAENAGGYFGTTLGNAAKGAANTIFKPWTWLSDRKTSREPAANNIKDAATARLEKLRESDPGIKRILSTQDVSNIGDKMWDAVIHRGENRPAEDALAGVRVKDVSEAVSGQVADGVRRSVYEETERGIRQHVQGELEKTRNNGFLGMIFKFLEMIGLGGVVAKLFGMPIPEKQEINNAAKIASEAAGEASRNIGAMGKEDFIASVKSNVKESLKQNKKYIPSFSDEQMNEIASRVAGGIEEKYDDIPKPAPSGAYAAAAGAVHDSARGAATDATEDNLGKLPPKQIAEGRPRSAVHRSNPHVG